MHSIAIARTPEEIDACFPVMSQLRPKIRREDFVKRVQDLHAAAGLTLAFIDAGGIKAVAGYRVSDWLAGGRYLEIEDLVTAEHERSRGYGGLLFDWLMAQAAREGCLQVRLVSNVRRVDAHRFYLRKGMAQEAYYFSKNV
ncbi:MAG TPA: GNAT family N-acetyltransferase [Steroidobacteraceae bacterium]|jgi:GNAT superfamily N-acetyltransferase|nr:GNAT family N-acetyltransferase [Steroidobacteraceae bacterium]